MTGMLLDAVVVVVVAGPAGGLSVIAYLSLSSALLLSLSVSMAGLS